MIIYLHGFRSGPASFKARLLESALQARGLGAQWWCPQLSASPREAVDAVRSRLQSSDVLIGSSLGGFYATVLAEETGCKAVLLNPAVRPERDLRFFIGTHASYHDSAVPFIFTAEHVAELEVMATALPSVLTQANRYLLLAATGDEVLSYAEMTARFPQAQLKRIDGSNHAISEFADYLPLVLAFCGVGAGLGLGPI
jgi:uncharacterized protein